jgi:hypothetical protein
MARPDLQSAPVLEPLETRLLLSATPSGYSYDNQAALAYALTWFNNFNTARYANYSGSDSANFVGQCLIAGGLDTSSGLTDSYGSFLLCDDLHFYLLSSPAVQQSVVRTVTGGGNVTDPDWFGVGDVAIMGVDDGLGYVDPWYRACIAITDTKPTTRAVIATHTPETSSITVQGWLTSYPGLVYQVTYYDLTPRTEAASYEFAAGDSLVALGNVEMRMGPGDQYLVASVPNGYVPAGSTVIVNFANDNGKAYNGHYWWNVTLTVAGQPKTGWCPADWLQKVDLVAPKASLVGGPVLAGPNAGDAYFDFVIQYTDNMAIDYSTIGTGDIEVTGPNGFDQFAAFRSVDVASDGTPRKATYRLDAPGGTWDKADNGLYTFLMSSGQVTDLRGNPVAAGSLGTMNLWLSLASLTVTGPAEVNESTKANYTCTATYDDATTSDVTALAKWTVTPAYATISAGALTAPAVSADRACKVTATLGGKSGFEEITIKNIIVVLTGLALTGPTDVNEKTSGVYTLMASFSDGSNKNVTALAKWQSDVAGIAVYGGKLAAPAVLADQLCHLTAAYGGQVAAQDVTIHNVITALVSIEATDPSGTEAHSPAMASEPAVFRITRTGSTAKPLTVNLKRTGAAVMNTDYKQCVRAVTSQKTVLGALATSVTIPAGESAVDLIITPVTDCLTEGDETVVLTLDAKASYAYDVDPALPAATVTIHDPPPLTIDHAAFLALYQARYGPLDAGQTAGLDQFLTFIEQDAGMTDLRWAAYVLATAQDSVGPAWQPMEEDPAAREGKESSDPWWGAESAKSASLYFTPSVAAAGPILAVTSPNGGGTWNAGSTNKITWTAKGDLSQVQSFAVAYSLDGGLTFHDIATVPAGTLSQTWTTPAYAATRRARIRISALDAGGIPIVADMSDTCFTVGKPPKPVVLAGTAADAPVLTGPGAPASPGAVISTLTPEFTWDAVAGAAAYRLDIYKVGGLTPVYSNVSLTGTSVTVPAGVLISGAKYRWEMKSYAGGTGLSYYGRGYIPLTWAFYYDRLGTAIGQPLLAQPDLALQPDVAYQVLSYGMLHGSFAGAALSRYINARTTDYVGARKVASADARGAVVAAYAKDFASFLTASLLA